jgi:hypothetical protein
MVRLVRHRQTKGAETDRLHLRPPRHILTLLSREQRAELEVELEKARQAGDLAWVNRVLSILLFAEGLVVREIARVLRASGEAVRTWFKRYLVNGARGLRAKKSPGRPPKLCKTKRRPLAELVVFKNCCCLILID